MAHELVAPLSVIDGKAQRLLRAFDDLGQASGHAPAAFIVQQLLGIGRRTLYCRLGESETAEE
ncbi:hypothetical protein [Nitrospira sp. Kam-Ns4a]